MGRRALLLTAARPSAFTRRAGLRVLAGALAGVASSLLAAGAGSAATRAPPRLFVHHGGSADGGGHPLVLLHGLGATGRYFAHRVDDVGRDHEWWAPDLLGFGASPRPADARYDLDDHARAVERSLPATRAKPILVGHSFGAVVALALAARHPERYAGVVVISLPVFASAAEAKAHLRALSAMSAGVVDDDPLWHVLAWLNPAIGALHAGALFGLPDDVYVDSTRHTWTSLRRSLTHGLLATDVAALARRVRVPVLFIHGARDETAPVQNAVALAHEIGAAAVVVDDDDHDLFLHHPDRVWAAVRRFEASLAGPG